MKKYDIGDTGSISSNEKGFTRMMKDYNVGLNIFKSDTTFTTWKKMKYNESSMLVELIPCN